MNYQYKLTTHGRAALAACMDLEKPMRVTRVAFGSGKVGEDAELADVHELLCYVSEGAVSQRSHEGERFRFTIQYANAAHPEVDTFFLSEYIVYMEDPETGEDVDLLYGTLGDYRQPVPKYSPAYPPSVFNLPLVLVLSSDINAQVSATAGLVTYEELAEITGKLAVRVLGLSIPSEGWRESAGGRYPYSLDLPLEEATLEMAPFATVLEEGEETAENCGLSPRAETVPGAVRFYTVAPPESDIPISLALLRDSTGIVLSAPGGGGGLDLPLATKDAPGMVKPGRGLLVAGDGTLSVDVAEQGEIDEMLAGLDGGEGE